MSSIAITGGATGTGVFSLLAPSTSTNRTLTLPDNTGTILTTGTPGVPVNGPAFSAYNPSTQNPSRQTWTKAILSAENFDTNNCFDSSTNYRFTPTLAGYYQINATGIATASPTEAYVAIYKNNALVMYDFFNASGTNQFCAAFSELFYANGSTDYFELFMYTDATSPAFSSLKLSGFLARAA